MVQLKSFKYLDHEFAVVEKRNDTPIIIQDSRSESSGSRELDSSEELQQASFVMNQDEEPHYSGSGPTPSPGRDSPPDEWQAGGGSPEFAQSPQAPLKSGRPRLSLLQLPGESPRSLGRPDTPQPGASHFEIRWSNLSLAARRSKLPRFLAESSLYKMAASSFGKTAEVTSREPELCYSPPIGNKRLLALNSPLPSARSASAARRTDDKPEPVVGEQLPLGELANGLSPDDYRPILSNISGSVYSGQLTAILGPSGVGKTSLLNSLTGRNRLTGSGRVQLIGATNLKRVSVVTVPQMDVLPEKLTVIEDLRFTSRLKNTSRNFDHEANIKRIVSHLQMDKFLATRIDKLSGGEARRLSIGRELLNSPDIMILDEPTSGLDANTCKKIIQALRDIVEHSDNILGRPMSIIVTIHQPQREVLKLFHRLYVMAIGGCAIYEGPPSNLMPYLMEQSSLGRVTPMDQLNENPAIVAIEVASGEFGPHIIGELAARHELQSMGQWPSSPHMGQRTPLSVSPRIGLARPGSVSPLVGQRQKSLPADQSDRMSAVTSVSYASSYDAELPEPVGKLKVDKRLRRSVVMKGDLVSHSLTLMSRCWILTTRDMFLMSIRILGFLLVAGGMVQIFAQALDAEEHQCPSYQTEPDDLLSFMGQAKGRLLGLQRMLRQGTSTHLFFFHLMLCITIVTSALTGLLFPLQMRMFVREYKNGWYSPLAFVLSNTLAELPIDMIGPTLSLLIVYPLCHQPESTYHWREACYILVIVTACLICKSQAQIVGALMMNHVEMSVFMSCVMVTPPALLSGIAVRVSQMATPLQWLSYGSFLRYAFESLFVLRFGRGICTCDPELVHGYPLMPSSELVPNHLNSFASSILELNNVTTSETTTQMPGDNQIFNANSIASPIEQPNNENLFVKFMRLITDAGNMNVPNLKTLGDCQGYTSLFLLDQGVEDNVLFRWIAVLMMMFLLSRIITYFVIKSVIKGQQ